MEMRAYTAADRAACLALFDGNAPEYFTAAERAAYEDWLDAPQGSYFVVEHDGALAGCGGIAAESSGLASLTWLMVRRDLHGQGLGRFLVFYLLKQTPAGVSHVRLVTIPAVVGFFAKQGFRVREEGPGGVEMLKKLQVCS